MLRVVERGRRTAYAGSGDNFIGWNFADGVPVDFLGNPRISESVGEVWHEFVVYSTLAQERYTAGCEHELRGTWKSKHTWRGFTAGGLPIEIVEEVDTPSFFWNIGSEQTFKCGAGIAAYHHVDTAEILGDPVQFPTGYSGTWSATQTDGFATVTATLTVICNNGSASVIATSMTGYPLAAIATASIEAQAVGRASWNVRFHPIYPDGTPVTGKHCLVILGDVESAGFNASAYADRVAMHVHEREAPFEEVFELPIETVRSKVYRACGAVWFEPISGGLIETHTDTAVQDPPPDGIVYDAAVWSRRTSCAVIWSRKAYGQTPSSLLDDIGSSSAVSYGLAHVSRHCQHRYHDAAEVTHIARASMRLHPLRDFVLAPWHYNLGGVQNLVGEWLEAPADSSREFWSNLGNANDYGNAHEFRPYRWMDLSVESEVVQSQTVTLEWNSGLGAPNSGRKSWVIAIPKGTSTVRVDLRDTDLLNGLPVEEVEQLDPANPGVSRYMPPTSTSYSHRFGGMGAVNSVRITLPQGVRLKISRLRLIAEQASIEHWRGSTHLGGIVDGVDELRVEGSSAKMAAERLSDMGLVVVSQDWNLNSAWLTQGHYGSASILNKTFEVTPKQNLLSGATLFVTNHGSDFRGYWGQSQEQPIGTAPVDVEVESLFGHRLTATAIPALDSALTMVWTPGADRQIPTDKSGAGRHNEPSMSLDFPVVNPRFFCPRHPEPREEEVLVWSFQVPQWSGIAFSPRGEGRRPSRDVNAAQRHVRATATNGRLTTARRDNTVAGNWTATSHGERSQGAAVRIERASNDQRVHVLNEKNKILSSFRSRLDAESLTTVGTLGSGEYPTMTVLPGNRIASYWIAGDSILGQIADREGQIIRGPEIVATGVLPVGVGAETSVGRSGLVGTLVTYQSSGFTRVDLCRDGLTAEPVVSVEAGDLPEILALRDGRRFLYWAPEASGNVRALVLDGRGQIVRPIQTVVTDLDPYTGLSVREAQGAGGARRVWMSAVRGGVQIELMSADGLVWS